MFKFNWTKIFAVLLLSLYVSGCDSVPRKDIVDIDNVITEKQKKEAQRREKEAEKAKVIPAVSSETVPAGEKPAYPLVTPTPAVMTPITAPPTPIAVVKETAPTQPASSTTKEEGKKV